MPNCLRRYRPEISEQYDDRWSYWLEWELYYSCVPCNTLALALSLALALALALAL